MGSGTALDLITVGRVSLDLFSVDIGSAFVDISGFSTQTGGSPTNVALGAARLGLRSAVLTAVGPDPVGDFVLRYLGDAGVDTTYVHRIPGTSTGLAVLGVQPPDRFPLVFYRENPADIHLSFDDVDALPLDQVRALLISGTALSRNPLRDALIVLLERAGRKNCRVFMDLDLRPDQWDHPRAFGAVLRPLLGYIRVLIGTEEEFAALLDLGDDRGRRPDPVLLDRGMQALSADSRSPEHLVLKRGDQGARIYQPARSVQDVPGFPVEILNTVGAGDAFASGFIYAWAQGWPVETCARFANACGAIVVTRHGCAEAMPRLEEVLAFAHPEDFSGRQP